MRHVSASLLPTPQLDHTSVKHIAQGKEESAAINIHLSLILIPQTDVLFELIRKTAQHVMGIAYEDRQSIENKKAQYCRFADTHEWDNFAALFTPDCVMEFLDANGQGFYDMGPHSTRPSARDLGNYLVQLRNVQQAIHMVGPLEFEQVDQDTILSVLSRTKWEISGLLMVFMELEEGITTKLGHARMVNGSFLNT